MGYSDLDPRVRHTLALIVEAVVTLPAPITIVAVAKIREAQFQEHVANGINRDLVTGAHNIFDLLHREHARQSYLPVEIRSVTRSWLLRIHIQGPCFPGPTVLNASARGNCNRVTTSKSDLWIRSLGLL